MASTVEDADVSYVQDDDDSEDSESEASTEYSDEDEDMETEDESEDDAEAPEVKHNAAGQAVSKRSTPAPQVPNPSSKPPLPPSRSTATSSRKNATGKRHAAAAKKKSEKKPKLQAYDKAIFATFRAIYPLNATVPKLSISVDAMGIMNGFMNQIFELIAFEAANIAKKNKRKTIGSREIRTATQLVLPGELAKSALLEGDKILLKYFEDEK